MRNRMHSEAASDHDTLLDDWRNTGADRLDPVRFRLIEAMARRARDHNGETGRLLQSRIAQLVAEYREALTRASTETSPTESPTPSSPALADLAALTKRLGARSHAMAAPAAIAPHRLHAAEPALADYFRDTLARVSIDRQLRESQAVVPENAGPLNTNQLVHRALSLMQEVSPGYLEQFLSYVDALAWLEGMHTISLVPEKRTRAKAGKAPSA